MANTGVYADWSWTCDDCGEFVSGFDTREDAEWDADEHECPDLGEG